MKSIFEYEKLVYSIIKKYSYNSNDLEDLYQVGMIALDKASKKYDVNSNCEFSSYAYLYIKGEVLKYIRENKIIKIGKDSIKLNSLINKTKDFLEQKYSRNVTTDEIANFLEIDVQKINETVLANEYVKSLEYTLNEEGKELNIYDIYGYNEKEYNADIIDLKNEIEKLDEFERKIINLRYYQDKTQQETSKELGMSQVQVSRKENKILIKLRDKLAA